MDKYLPYYHPILSVGKVGVVGDKLPLVVVGVANYLRQNFNIGGDKDVHLLFFPTNGNFYRVGSITIKRPDNSISCVYSENKSIHNAIKTVMIDTSAYGFTVSEKLFAWYLKSIYKCPKIALKDVLHLEDYK